MIETALVVNCLCGLATLAAPEAGHPTFAATLPNGATVELLAVTTNARMPDTAGTRPWWRPDGTVLSKGLFHYAGSSTGDSKARQFTLRIEAEPEYSCMTMNSSGPTPVQPALAFNEEKTPLLDVRVCAGAAAKDAVSDTLKVGVATGPWQTVQQWQDDAWHESDPDNIAFNPSEFPLIFFWPRTKRGAVVLDMVSAYTRQAVRIKITEKGGRTYYEAPRTHGRGAGLIRHQFWLWDTPLEELRAMTLEKRSFQWVEFQNVALEPNQAMDVRVTVLPAGPDAFIPMVSDPATCLGALLNDLDTNVQLPPRGHAKYEVRDGDRLLRCDYRFDGSLYRFHVEGKDTDFVKLFDGYRSVTWTPGTDYASINRLERMSGIVYKLDQYCPRSFIDQLFTHEVIPLPDEVIGGTTCKVLENIISSKLAVKLWVATEPEVFPLRIERYEHERLRYRYEAEGLRMWDNVVFPERISIASFRADDANQPTLISQKQITLKALFPGVRITPRLLRQDLPERVLARLPELKASVYSLVGKPIAVTKIPELTDHLEKGRPAIVCFVDINQRPSRHCLGRLKEAMAHLDEQGFDVLAVQISAVEPGRVDQWLKDNDNPFPLLPADPDFEQRRSTWGVTSLPWIVRTDDAHFVTEESLSPQTLDTLQRP